MLDESASVQQHSRGSRWGAYSSKPRPTRLNARAKTNRKRIPSWESFVAA